MREELILLVYLLVHSHQAHWGPVVVQRPLSES